MRVMCEAMYSALHADQLVLRELETLDLAREGDGVVGPEAAAQALAEGSLFIVGQGVIAEHQHGVFVHGAAQFVERGAVVNLAQVDGGAFGGERRG